jgi:putative intracellular protease/amidase
MPRNIAVLVFDGFADWEPAFALTGLRRWGQRTVTAVGFDRRPIVSMGGLRVLPDQDIGALRPDTTELLLIPGGDMWTEEYPASRLESTMALLTEGGTHIAAICAATVALARGGQLRGRRHTSNGAAFLRLHAPEYETPDLYVDALAVTDSGVITASGLGAIEFAHEIFAALGIFDESERQRYLDLYRHARATKEES